MFRFLTGIFLFLLSISYSNAWVGHPYASATQQEYLSCDVDGAQVEYIIINPLTSRGAELLKGSVARAGYLHTKERYVTLVSTEVLTLPYVLRQHIYAHECAHHRLGHSKQWVESSSYGETETTNDEIQADCKANQYLADIGFMKHDFEKLMAILVNYRTADRIEEIKKCLP